MALPPETRQIVAPAIVIPGVEGVGKTSLAANAEDVVIAMARGETGYTTLYNAGSAPRVPSVLIESFDGLLSFVDSLIADPQGRKTLALDALGGFERLCHEMVCEREFGGNWGEKGFAAYQRGFDIAVSDWLKLIAKLDKLRTTQRMTVIVLAHVKIETFKNPEGPDYDRYVADCHRKTWAATHKWADAVLFANFVTVTQEEKGRVRGKGGQSRCIYTERHAAWDAKSRFKMPPVIDLPTDPAQAWNDVWAAINGGNSQ